MTVRRLAALLLALIASAGTSAFGLQDVVDRARRLAAEPYVRVADIPPFMREIGYDQYRGMRYQARHNVWRDVDSRFEVAPLMPGGVYTHAVGINEVVGSTVRRVPFRKQSFSFDEEDLRERIPDDVGYAGFEILYAFDRKARPAKFMVFAGGSYFRAIEQGGQWGLSVRGAAIDTGLASGEEFPDFTEFWLVRPDARATSLTVYALLDSPRLAGAYEFVISPGAVTRLAVTSVLFTRASIGQLGLAALTSMFFYGENTPRPPDAWRPEVHDSDGLLVGQDAGSWTWQPLVNPSHITMQRFPARAFALMQRDTAFRSYEDAEANYHRRPSALVELERGFGAGSVLLVQLPTQNEFLDNVVAFWSPQGAIDGGTRLEHKYQLAFGPPAIAQTKLGRVVNTFVGRDVVDATSKGGQHRFIVDFKDLRLRRGETAASVAARVGAREGTDILEHQVQRIGATGVWRLSILARGVAGKPLALHASLSVNGRPATETWRYELDADNVLRRSQ